MPETEEPSPHFTLLELPIPKLVVFYNGPTDKDDEVILRLSDSFPAERRADSDIEVRVRMLNINHGRNKAIMDRCRPLNEYAWFVGRVRELRKNHETEAALKMAITEMPEDYEIKRFIMAHLKEVEGMLEEDYSQEKIRELFIADGIKKGLEQGLAQGEEERKKLEKEIQRLREENERLKKTTSA